MDEALAELEELGDSEAWYTEDDAEDELALP